MRADIHRAALRAAAKVAFSTAALGCGGVLESGVIRDDSRADASNAPTGTDVSRPSPGENTPLTDASVADVRTIVDATLADVRTDSAQMPDAAKATCTGGSQEAFICCEERVHEAFPDAGGSWNPDPNLAPETRACCQMLGEHYDADWRDGGADNAWAWGKDQDIKMACCSNSDNGGSVMPCPPWGPPVPPAMLVA